MKLSCETDFGRVKVVVLVVPGLVTRRGEDSNLNRALTPRRKMEQIGSIPVLTASKAFLTDKNADVYHVFNVQQLVASRVFLALILYAAVCDIHKIKTNHLR